MTSPSCSRHLAPSAVDGGYQIYAHKIFGSLSPVWTRLGIHAMDTSDPANPKIVHAFLPRDTDGYRIVETWDTLGMRATRSDDTLIEGAVIPDPYVARVVPAGLAGADPFVLGIFAWAEPTFASMYLGLAERALELAVAGAKKKTSIALGGRAMAYHPMIQHSIAEMAVELESITAHVERIAVGLVESGRLRHGLASQAGLGQVQGGRRRQANRRPGDGRLRWSGNVQDPTNSSASTATSAAAASTRPTVPSSTSWWASRPWAFWAKNLAGEAPTGTAVPPVRPAPAPDSPATRFWYLLQYIAGSDTKIAGGPWA